MIAVAVVRIGVTPELTEILGVTVPEYKIFPVDEEAVPTVKCVIVDVLLVQAGKLIFATGDTLLAVTAQPPEVRATATRA